MGVVLAMAACGAGRTSMLPPSCEITVTPTAIDFGSVLPGELATRTFKVRNVGGAECTLTNIATSPASDSSFTSIGPATAAISPGGSMLLAVAFRPASAKIPLTRTGQLVFDVDATNVQHVSLPVGGKIQSDCKLVVAPKAVDFGHVPVDTKATQSVQLINQGSGPCEVTDIAIAPSSAKTFALVTPTSFALEPGEQSFIVITFWGDASKPHHRTGELTVASNDATHGQSTVPLSADVDVGCDLSWLPTSLDFGKVTLNTSIKGNVSLTNDGSDTCYVSDIALTADSDHNFMLLSTSAVAVPVGGNALIRLAFSAADSAPPHLKTGTLAFQTGNQRAPSARIPLSAYVNSVCIEASRWIYTVGQDGQLARFDPDTLTFTDIARLRCPTSDTPNSMAVDQNAVAWVAYRDGNLFEVDTGTGDCKATRFEPNQHELRVFGMGFVFDPSTGKDTLFIAGGKSVDARQSTLATVSFPSLVVTPVGSVAAGLPEMSGTGDGQLWGFIPQGVATGGSAVLVRLDPRSGATLESHTYRDLTDGEAWAMKFWGGSFWVFLGSAVYKISRDTPDRIETAIAYTGRSGIVGAGVSTCAPVAVDR